MESMTMDDSPVFPWIQRVYELACIRNSGYGQLARLCMWRTAPTVCA